MDTDAFLKDLPALFEDFPASPVPIDRSNAPIHSAIEGLSEENNLALVALAARHLGPGEVYAEAGTFHGRSVIAAVSGSDADAIAIDNFSFEGGERTHIEGHLTEFGVAGRVQILEGDTLEVLRSAELPPIGVFFYDADHSTEATVAALQAVLPHLAPEALIVVDDADWPKVRAGRDQFLAANPSAALALAIGGRDEEQPWWWAGMDIIVWRE